MKKLLIIALAVGVLFVLLAGMSSADEAKKADVKKAEATKAMAKKAEAKKAEIHAGQKVFTEAKCQMCHTVFASGIGEPPAEDAEKAKDGPPDLSQAGVGRTSEWMSLFLQKEEALNDKKHMMEFKGSDEELTALVDWLLTLKPAEEKVKKAAKGEDCESHADDHDGHEKNHDEDVEEHDDHEAAHDDHEDDDSDDTGAKKGE